MDIEQLMKRAYDLRNLIRTAEADLKEVNKAIYDKTIFKDGSSTGHLFCGKYKAVVKKKITIKWDQERLEQLRKRLGDKDFKAIFKTEYKPICCNRLRMVTEKIEKQINDCKSEKENSPYIEIEYTGKIN